MTQFMLVDIIFYTNKVLYDVHKWTEIQKVSESHKRNNPKGSVERKTETFFYLT